MLLIPNRNMKKLIFASSNENKVREIRSLLPEGFELLSLNDLSYPHEIPETADTFAGNALIKARTIAEYFQLPCFADDSGLEVEALNGAPGVFSARYAGEPKNDLNNLNLLLRNMEGLSNRKARFVTVIAWLDGQEECLFEGTVNGQITEYPKGSEGFGYDPVFVPEHESRSFAEMSLKEKNKYSHRARAFLDFTAFLEKN